MSKKTDADPVPPEAGDSPPEQPVSPAAGDGKGEATKGDAPGKKGAPKRKGSVSSGGKSFATTLAARSERSLADMYRIQDGIPEEVIEWSVSAPDPAAGDRAVRGAHATRVSPVRRPPCPLSNPAAIPRSPLPCSPARRFSRPLALCPLSDLLPTLRRYDLASPCPRPYFPQLKCFGHFDASANGWSKEIIRDPLLDDMDPWEVRESLFLGGRHEVTGGNPFAAAHATAPQLSFPAHTCAGRLEAAGVSARLAQRTEDAKQCLTCVGCAVYS